MLGPSLPPRGIPSLWGGRNAGKKAGWWNRQEQHILRNCLKMNKLKVNFASTWLFRASRELALATRILPYNSSGPSLSYRPREGLREVETLAQVLHLRTEASLLVPRLESFEAGRGHLNDMSLSQVQRAARTHICLGWSTLSWTLKNRHGSKWNLGEGKVNNLEGRA